MVHWLSNPSTLTGQIHYVSSVKMHMVASGYPAPLCSSSLQHVANDGDVILLMVCYEVHVVPWWALTIHRLRGNTDVFVLLVYWVWKANDHFAVQMEKSMLEITLSGHWARNTRAS